MNEQALLTIRVELAPLDDDIRARLRAGVLDLVGLDGDGVATITPTLDIESPATGATEPILLDTLGEAGTVIDLTDRTPRRPSRFPDAGRSPRDRVLLVAAAVIVSLLAVGVGVTRQNGPATTEVTATLATATNGDELIAALAQAPDTPLADGRYEYERIESATPVNGGPQISVGTSQHWVNNQDSGRVVESANELLASGAPGEPRSPGRQRGSDISYDAPDTLRFHLLRFGDLRNLPSEPAALRSELLRLIGSSTEKKEDLYDGIADLLTLHSTPTAVRAGLARVLMDSGATVLGQVADRSGRSGLGIAVTLTDGSRRVFVLDVTTYHRLGDFTVPAGAPTTADAAIAWNTVLDNYIVDSTRNR